MKHGRRRGRARSGMANGSPVLRGRPRTSGGEPLVRRLGRIVLAAQLLLAPLVFSTRTLEVFEFPKVLLAVATAVLLVTGSAALALEWALFGGPASVWRAARAALRRAPLAWGVLAYLLSAALSTATSISPRTSWRGAPESFAGLVTVSAYAALFFAAWALCKNAAQARGLLVAGGAGVGGAALYALVQFVGRDPLRWTRTHEFLGVARVFGTMGNPNFLGALMAMGAPLLAALALGAWRRGRRAPALAFACAGALALAALGASLSRGAWLAAGVGAGVLTFGLLERAQQPHARRRLLLAAAAAVLLAAAAVALVPRARAVVGAMAERVAFSLRQQPQERPVGGLALSQDPRLAIWSAAWRMFRERPMTGVGLDAFQLAYQRQRDMAVWSVEGGHKTPSKAHNEILHTLATQGLPGGAALALLAAGAVFAFRRALEAQAAGPELVVGIGAALAAFAFQSLFNPIVAGCVVLAVVLLGLLAALSRSAAPETPEPPLGRGPSGTVALALAAGQTLVAIVGAAALWWLVARPLTADVAAQRGVVARKGGAGHALPHFAEAVRVDAGSDLYWTHLGVSHYELAQAMGVLPARRDQLQAARTAFERALALVPANSYTQGGLAHTLAAMARLDPPLVPLERAYAAYEQAMALDPHNPYWPAEAARVALDGGDLARVAEWGRRAQRLQPDYGTAAWLLGSVELQNVLPLLASSDERARAAAFAPVGEALRDAATNKRWYGDDGTRAVCGSQAAAALVAAGRLDEARAVAELATQVDPDYADARFNLGKVYERLGDLSRAQHEYGQALRIEPGHAHARRALAALQPH